MTNPDPRNPHEASRRWHEKFEHLPAHPGPEPEITGVTVGGKECIGGEDHLYIAWHEPEHNVYWIRTCAICGRPDWDDLDREIREFIIKAVPSHHPANEPTGHSVTECVKRGCKQVNLTNPEGSDKL